jgi:hypothetical protein
MASVARIPFTPFEVKTIGSMNGWMMFFAIVHFIAGLGSLLFGLLGMLGAMGLVAQSPALGIFQALQMMTLLAVAIVLLAEGGAVIMARASLSKMLSTDTHDQDLLSTAFARLKIFFALELAVFVLFFVFAILGAVIAFIAPEQAGGSAGEDLVERIREMRRSGR